MGIGAGDRGGRGGFVCAVAKFPLDSSKNGMACAGVSWRITGVGVGTGRVHGLSEEILASRAARVPSVAQRRGAGDLAGHPAPGSRRAGAPCASVALELVGRPSVALDSLVSDHGDRKSVV